MKKFLKSFLLLSLVLLMLPSCTSGVPSALVRESVFELDEEKLSQIRAFAETVKTDVAYLEKGVGNIQEFFYTENGECISYKENSIKTIEAYRDGKLYNYDYESEKLTRKDYDFDSSEYEGIIENGIKIAKNVLTYEADNFDAYSYKVAGDRKNLNVTLDLKDGGNYSDLLGEEIYFVQIGFVYNTKEKIYSKLFVSWQENDGSYIISFDDTENKTHLNEMIQSLTEMQQNNG